MKATLANELREVVIKDHTFPGYMDFVNMLAAELGDAYNVNLIFEDSDLFYQDINGLPDYDRRIATVQGDRLQVFI